MVGGVLMVTGTAAATAGAAATAAQTGQRMMMDGRIRSQHRVLLGAAANSVMVVVKISVVTGR